MPTSTGGFTSVSTNEERRQAAKRKLEERLETEQRAARKRRMTIIGVSVAIVVIVAGTITGLVVKKVSDDREKERWTACAWGPQEDPKAQPVDPPEQIPAEQRDEYRKQVVEYNKQIQDYLAKKRPAPKPGDKQLKKGTLAAVFETSQGSIPITLKRDSAPCNTGAIEHLIRGKFFDDSSCHRMTASTSMKVLQCGDPTGTGMGGPGWTSPDEPPTDLKPSGAPNAMGQQAVTYPRGTIAIANNGQANSGSSQFFLVIGDSTLPSDYAVVGTVDEAGLAVLDKVAKGGIVPGASGSKEDGAPKLPVKITTATVKN
jgi:peptidyl-prolyl cis-trans isomerase B (cyclophilin B)